MNRFISTLLIILSVFSTAFPQTTIEPGNNINMSLAIMKNQFSQLRFIKTDAKEYLYEDGYPEDGITVFFYFKNNYVVEECMIIQGTDGYPRLWFETMAESHVFKNCGAYNVISYNAHH